MSGPDPLSGPEPAPRPGLRTFTLEGRAAPGLFLVGWLATIMGGGVLIVASLSGVDQTARSILAFVGLALLSVGLVAGAGSQAMERRARAVDGGYAGPSPFLAFAAAVPISLLLILIVVQPIHALGITLGDPAATLLTVSIQGLVYLALIRLLVVGDGALSWRDMGIGGRPLVPFVEDIAWGIVLAVPVIVVTTLVAAVLFTVLPVPDSPLPPSGAGAGILFNLLAAVIVAPVGEELFFRGYATTAWLRAMSPWAAILRGALFFAAVHVLTVGGNDFGDALGRASVAFLTRLPVAITLGLIFARRRSLAAPIALHATYNGLLFLAQLSAG